MLGRAVLIGMSKDGSMLLAVATVIMEKVWAHVCSYGLYETCMDDGLVVGI
jgi:hypothetical protein